ncbi:MAG: hypothetical protein NVS4B11_04870 [Ktedonobacteraceae bacterium]
MYITMKDQMQETVDTALEQVQQEVDSGREPWYRASRRTQILALVYLLQFALFTALAWFVHFNPVLPVDIVITKEFQENKAPWLQTFMVAVSFLGNQQIVFVVLILLTAFAFWLVRLRLEALIIITLSVISAVVNFLVKLIVSRPRPTTHLVDVFQGANGQSFPSGHVMSYVAFWGLLFSFGLILFNRRHWWHYLLLIIPALFVLLVGPSRIYLGDHWASDVLGGYLFGGLLLGITLWIYLRLKAKGYLTPKVTSRKTLVRPTIPSHRYTK